MFLYARLISFLDPTLAWWPSTRIVWEISNPARCYKKVALAILFCTCIPRLVSDGAKEGWRISWIMESSLTRRTVKYPDGSLGLSTMRYWRGSVAQKNTWQTLPREYLTWMQPSLPLLTTRRKYLPGFWSGFDLSWRGASWDCWEALTPNLGLPHLPSHRLRFYQTHNIYVHHSLTHHFRHQTPQSWCVPSTRLVCAALTGIIMQSALWTRHLISLRWHYFLDKCLTFDKSFIVGGHKTELHALQHSGGGGQGGRYCWCGL